METAHYYLALNFCACQAPRFCEAHRFSVKLVKRVGKASLSGRLTEAFVNVGYITGTQTTIKLAPALVMLQRRNAAVHVLVNAHLPFLWCENEAR